MSDYMPITNNDTVVEHPPYNLPSLGIVVNIHLRVVICITCGRAIDSPKLISHLRKDLPFVDVPDDLPNVLERAFKLVPYSSVSQTPGPIFPIFGIALHPQPLFFCDCGKGFGTYDILRSHQTRAGDRMCLLKGQHPGFHRGYGQRLSGSRSFFEVEPGHWLKLPDGAFHFSRAFSRSLPPLRDYATMEIKGAENEMNTSSFFYTQRWISHLEGYTPTDIQEVLTQSTFEVTFGERLRQVAEEFLGLANNEIKNQNSFGILKLMGQTTE